MDVMERKAGISGVGVSNTGRKLMRAPSDLFVDAALAALADAGLTRDDIDGITSYPGREKIVPGMSPLGVDAARSVLGLKTRWHSSGSEGPAQMSALMIAAMAVATGQARHVLVFRCLTESSAQTGARSGIGQDGSRIDGPLSWLLPMGAVSAANWAAMSMRAYMDRFGLTREQLGAQAVRQRENAQKNPLAVMKGKPLSLDDYLGARMISDPVCLFDCDVPIDGCVVIIVSAMEAASDLRKRPIRIEAMSGTLSGRESWDQRDDITTMASHDACKALWARTDLKPADVDVAGLYDGFSIFSVMWLESFGFCGRGEAGPFLEEGHTALGGRIPMNTGGGQLSAGRLHGYGHLHEVCLQLWGEAGERQVSGAQVGAVGMGGGPLGGALLLSRA